MDLRQVRADLATVAATAGFNAWDFEPDDPQQLPAAVVGAPLLIERMNAHVTKLQLPVGLYVSNADARAATALLDQALSTGVGEGSFLDALDSLTQADTEASAWRSARFESASQYQRVALDGGGSMLAVPIVLELTA